MLRILLTTTLLALMAGDGFTQNRNRQENKSLLGVVTAPAKKGVEVLHVLEKSPAEAAGIQVGDLLQKLDDTRLAEIIDVDDALREVAPGATVKIELKRDKKSLDLEAEVIERSRYSGSFLRRPAANVDFDAPPWFAYAWANVTKKKPAPTRENTAGKVVMIHTFQSW